MSTASPPVRAELVAASSFVRTSVNEKDDPSTSSGRTKVWRGPLIALGATIAAILLIFARDVADMATLWWTISTYQHCLLVLPIAGWLVWLRHREVAGVTPAGWGWGLLLVAAASLVWLVGQAADVALFRHIGVVAMIQASVVAIMGPAVARAVLFPLFYLVFLVPFGDELTGPMQTLTATMTMALLGVSGVPATIDGIFITTRSGWFEVAEACAGVKFLIAMVAYGALAAHVCFRSVKRRTLFMLAAVVVPVLANGVRAWATIYAAEWVGVEAATGFDHIVYGWVFFAVVMLVIMAAAWPFFDRRIGEDWLGGKAFAVWKPVLPALLVAPLVVAIAGISPLWDGVASAAGRIALPASPALPKVAGWTRTGDSPRIVWRPRFDGADHILIGRYGDATGQRVDVGVAMYGWQGAGREIIGFGQGAVDPASHWAWVADAAPIAGAGTQRLAGPTKVARDAATLWFVGGRRVDGTTAVKLATLKARLGGSDRSAATLIVSAEGSGSRAAIAAFVRAMGDPEPRIAAMFAQARVR